MAFQVGRNVGSGTPVLFTWVHVHFGFWKLDKLNIVNMILAVFCLVATILNFFRARDLSKDLERMKEKYAAPQEDKERKDETTSKSLMKWSELLQIDIITLCLAYSFVRYATGTFTSSMTIMLPMDYHWSLNGMLVLIMCTNCFTSVTTIILVKLGLLKNPTRSFYLYILSLGLASCMMISLMLTDVGVLTTVTNQAVFFVCLLAAKNFVFVKNQITNTMLMLHLVKPQDSSFIMGIRTAFGISFKGLAFAISPISSKYPEYHSPALVLLILPIAAIILYRRNIHLEKTKNE